MQRPSVQRLSTVTFCWLAYPLYTLYCTSSHAGEGAATHMNGGAAAMTNGICHKITDLYSAREIRA